MSKFFLSALCLIGAHLCVKPAEAHTPVEFLEVSVGDPSNLVEHEDIDRFANRLTTTLFLTLMAVQVVNVFVWQSFPALFAGVTLNLAGAAMQFARLIRSAFRN